ncbi:magnesium and cobalt transport protein CorA [Kibdelosporangium philippinense]|uniref:Magnesium and cobalt transport protein CorA n=1 Tax=Kibdelosporangium philippinense TaxID=211113 RepID=A0ABS8ZD02_9PSEU|nr:magnesium and cobalt transport protein CorA [Kibdelosporangium philippinense]MCE7004556.1 magnesium and cobalt transport protein CorA [Kibdelosporangium philippinense]
MPSGESAAPQRKPVPVSAYVVDCAVYVNGARLPGRWSHGDAIAEVRKRGEGFVWIGLYKPQAEQLQDIAETYGLPEPAVEAAARAHQRPKLDRYDDSLFMVLKTVHYVAHESPDRANEIVETGEIMAFLGPDFIVTVRHGDHSGLRGLRRELEAMPQRLRFGPSVVLHAVADRVVDDYLDVSELFEHDIEEAESVVFGPRNPAGAEQMYLLKREVLELRRSTAPLSSPLRRLADGDLGLVPREVRSYFRDVDDHLAVVIDRVTRADELLNSLVNATLAKITLQQNNDMRKITAWAAVIAIPTMAVGVYGMNFTVMPELGWKYGYPIALGVIVLACLVVYRILRRNKWLGSGRTVIWVVLLVLAWLTLIVVQISLGLGRAP